MLIEREQLLVGLHDGRIHLPGDAPGQLIALLLGRKRLRRTDDGGRAAEQARAGEWITSVACRNNTCITNTERGMRARLTQVGDTGLLRCAYCDQEQDARSAGGGTK